MKHVVLKPFGHYPDGFTREALVPGDERDFGASAAGLLAEKMIGEIGPLVKAVEPADEVTETPVDAIAETTTATANYPRRGRKRK